MVGYVILIQLKVIMLNDVSSSCFFFCGEKITDVVKSWANYKTLLVPMARSILN